MLTKIISKNLYKKTVSFFSEDHQEKIINVIEQEFYTILRDLKNNKSSRKHQRIRLLDLQQKIDTDAKTFYFNPELNVYIESLRNLTSSYIRKLSDTHVK